MKDLVQVKTFNSPDSVRKGVVYEKDQGHVVEFYENDLLVRTLMLSDKSVYYAQDAAENWTLRIIKE